MASLLPLRLICGSMFLLFTVLGTALSFPLSSLAEMKMYWTHNFCVFPSPQLYVQEKILLQQEANPVDSTVEPVPLPVLQSCENPDGVFHKTLCSTFFHVSKVFCGYNDTSLNEHLQLDVLAKSVDDVTWDVCFYATFLGIFKFITQEPGLCESQCEKNPQTAPVCKWLIAAAVSYTEVQAAKGKAKAEAERARKQGGTAGQQQAIPKKDSEGTRANKPDGLGTEPPTRPETLPLTTVPDANNATEQKTTPEGVLTNESNVTKIPVSVHTTQHPRADGLNPGLPTGKPKPQPSSTTPSTPLNSKSVELQGEEDEENSRQQDQTGGDQNVPSEGNELQSEEHSEDVIDDDEPPSGHFMAYFVTAVVLCVAAYVIYHNKKKIFAFVLEGRREGQQRRRSSAGSSSGGSSTKYHKLTPSVEEVMPSLEKSTASTNYIY